eukprot:gene20915-27763_t
MATTSSNKGPIPGLFKGPAGDKQAKRQASKQRDRHFRLGGLLCQAQKASEPVERMLAVVRIMLDVLCDAVRPSADPQDTPITVLGSHLASRRELGSYADGSYNEVHVQEICTFDEKEGPKILKKEEQVYFGAVGSVKLLVRKQWGGYGQEHSEGTEDEAWEDYTISSFPSLVLKNPLPSEGSAEGCQLEWKGEMRIQCSSTTLVSHLHFKNDDAVVKGVLEQHPTMTGEGGSSSKPKGGHVIGTFTGSWRGTVMITCPSL